jgi:hypothetical protein
MEILEGPISTKKECGTKVTHPFYLKDYTGDAMKLRVK